MGVLSYHKMIDKWNFNAEKNPQICEYLGYIMIIYKDNIT